MMQIRYGKRSVLLTGDAERMIEDELVNTGRLTPVTLLKVGHHGSKTSSSEEFLDAVKPEFALISAGYLNQFHHPNADVLSRLAEHHTMVLRTDLRGLVTFRTDGNRVDIRTVSLRALLGRKVSLETGTPRISYCRRCCAA